MGIREACLNVRIREACLNVRIREACLSGCAIIGVEYLQIVHLHY